MRIFITAVVVATFEKKLRDVEGSWELVVDKAKAWLEEQGVFDLKNVMTALAMIE